MQSATLIPHPTTPCPAVRHLTVRLHREAPGLLWLDYTLQGDIAGLRIPKASAPRRADGLWRHTCFEAFLAEAGNAGYREFNFSPSTEWAIYRFAAYREDMTAVEPYSPLAISIERDGRQLTLAARVDLRGLVPPPGNAGLRLALSAVIETVDGGLSYWALRHPSDKPDFHHPDGFALALDPPVA
jgi:hypothetical protein